MQNLFQETRYETDAEKFGWTIVQKDVFNFEVVYGGNWKCPDGINSAIEDNPVTQVSYNDALAFAEWSNTTIPTYKAYWHFAEADHRPINSNGTQIFPEGHTNVVGNVWEITRPDSLGQIRLAGGSYLCRKNMCNGTSPNRTLYVDAQTGNSHIGFAVIAR